jgi:hypothetical protein
MHYLTEYSTIIALHPVVYNAIIALQPVVYNVIVCLEVAFDSYLHLQ